MDIFDNLINNLEDLQKDLKNGLIMQDIITDNEPYIIDMNVENQLYEEGENRLGVSISDYQPYSDVTIQIKKSKGQPYDRVTLRDEGDFHMSFYLQTDREKFEIKASDWKAEFLSEKYGSQIFGLNENNQNILTWEYVYPDLLKQTYNYVYNNR